MDKMVTLQLDEETYDLFRRFAEADNRSVSNAIETAARRYIAEQENVDEYEMEAIRSDEALRRSLATAHQEADALVGRFVE